MFNGRRQPSCVARAGLTRECQVRILRGSGCEIPRAYSALASFAAMHKAIRSPAELAANWLAKQVAVIVTAGGCPIDVGGQGGNHDNPIVFNSAEDPVSWACSQPRPTGRQLTGVNFFIPS